MPVALPEKSNGLMPARLSARAKELGVKYFLISFCDLAGAARAKLVPAAAIDAACSNGAGFAGFAAWLDMTPADPDMLAMPDANSLIQLPWKPEVAWLPSDLVMGGSSVAQSPRQVLKRSLAKMRKLGFEFRTGVECEYFVLRPDGADIADAADRQAKPCYDQQALMRQYDLISEICDAMLKLGWGAYQNDHEDANGQFEMNWQYDDALVTADRQMFFKFMVKSLAEKHGLRATFMPKPFAHLTGNGCHMHCSLWDSKTQENAFLDPSDEQGLSRRGYAFVGGLLYSAEGLCAIANPVVNSYRRIGARATISGAAWSPSTISYTGNNRTHMIRIPDSGRFELGLADGAANPYLLAAAVLEAGMDGLLQQRDPGPRNDSNMHQQAPDETTRRLPDNLREALAALAACQPLQSGLGEEFIQAYLKIKRQEWREYSQQVSAWEVQTTLDC